MYYSCTTSILSEIYIYESIIFFIIIVENYAVLKT